MIGKLRGIVDETAEHHVVLDVGGVGYIAFCSGLTLSALPPAGSPATLLIETHVREDHIHLFGFRDEAERAWFLLLNSITGIGPKLALSILSVLPPEKLATAVAAQDKAVFRSVSGVGPRLAERIITELKGKELSPGLAGGVAVFAEAVAGKSPAVAGAESAIRDAVSALTNLGYSRSEAYQKVTALAAKHTKPSVETLIRESLQELAS